MVLGSLLPCHHAAPCCSRVGTACRSAGLCRVGAERTKTTRRSRHLGSLAWRWPVEIPSKRTHVIVVFHSQGVIRLETQTMLDVPPLVYYEPRIKAGRYLNSDILGLLFGPHNISGRGRGSHSPGKIHPKILERSRCPDHTGSCRLTPQHTFTGLLPLSGRALPRPGPSLSPPGHPGLPTQAPWVPAALLPPAGEPLAHSSLALGAKWQAQATVPFPSLQNATRSLCQDRSSALKLQRFSRRKRGQALKNSNVWFRSQKEKNTSHCLLTSHEPTLPLPLKDEQNYLNKTATKPKSSIFQPASHDTES